MSLGSMTGRDPSRFTVGQQVWKYDINAGRGRRPAEPERVEVVKVGRKLVTVKNPQFPGWPVEQYLIETGRRNDRFGHQWLVTDEERAEEERYHSAVKALREIGLETKMGATVPLDLLERLVAAIPAPAEVES